MRVRNNDRPRRTTAASFALAAMMTASCASRSVAYRPVATTPGVDGPSRASVVNVAVPSDAPGMAVGVEVEAPEGLALTQARLAPSAAPPCSAGLAAGAIDVDGRRDWRRPLTLSGTSRLALDFPLPEADYLEDGTRSTFAFVDLNEASARGSGCLRIPLPPASALQKRSAWSLGSSVDLDPPLLSTLTVAVRLGRWIGPVRVGAKLGASLRRCQTCASPLYLGAPVGLTAEVLPAMRPGAALGLEIAYVARPFVGATDGDRYFVYGPQATLRLAAAAARAADRPGGPQLRYQSLDLSLARWTAIGAEHWTETLFGLGWTWDASLR